jgi:hypothetical protein
MKDTSGYLCSNSTSGCSAAETDGKGVRGAAESEPTGDQQTKESSYDKMILRLPMQAQFFTSIL